MVYNPFEFQHQKANSQNTSCFDKTLSPASRGYQDHEEPRYPAFSLMAAARS
jgi:hypothetical protein